MDKPLEGEEDRGGWSLGGKVAIVTGASSGIGLETCRMLLDAGCHVVMACRNVEKGEMCKKDISAGSDEKASRCHVMHLNLAALSSVKSFASQVIKDLPNIHVLVNNAGVFCRHRSSSQDNLELTFAVNHLGHFLLTRLLLPTLLSSQPARIITVTSEAHRISALQLEDLQMEGSWRPLVAYGRSKSANILFTTHLAELLADTQVSAYSVHPGLVDTHLGDDLEGTCFMGLFRCCSCITCQRLLSPAQGAVSVFRLCQNPNCRPSGLYFVKRKAATAKGHSTDAKRAETLWRMSSNLCGLGEELVGVANNHMDIQTSLKKPQNDKSDG